jgi:hypothetical protein
MVRSRDQTALVSFAEFDASVQGWLNHVRHADSWGLRQHILEQPLRRP